MGPKALQFIHAVARKLLAKPTKPSEGITSIANRMNAEAKAGEIAETFRLSGIPLEKLDDFIKSEADVKKYLNIIESMNKPKGPTILGHRVIDATSSEGKGITEALFGKKGEVVDMTGKKIPPGARIMGGKEVKGNIVADTIATIKSKPPIDAMKEANSVIGRKGKYKNLTPEESQKILKDTNDHIFERDIPIDPEDMADGGVAGLLGEPTYQDDNHRVPFAGGLNAARRLFLKLMGGAAAGTVAAKSGLFGLLKGGGKKAVIKELTSVPIKDISGMPAWFKPLVNRVIKEGEEVAGEAERVIVHKTKLPDSKTDVYVMQDLNTGNVAVDIGMGKHGWSAGHHGQPVRLEYQASEALEGPIKKGKPTKTNEEFWVDEAEFTGGHQENVKFEDTISEKFGSHGSNFDEVEKFATGKIKKKTGKASIKAEREHWVPEGDMASGGRVPYWKGGTWKMIKEAIKHNKIFGVGGPPYKPGATSFDIKQLTKDRFGSELNLQELKEMGTKKEGFSKFLTGFKEYKADVIKQQLLNSKQEAKIRIKVSKDMLKKNPEDAMNKKISSQMIRDSEKRLIDLDEALKDIDVYKAMKEKTGVASHATGGRVSLSAGGLAGMLGE